MAWRMNSGDGLGRLASASKSGDLQVLPNGVVIPPQAGGGTGAFGLDGVSFVAATC
jgi:hypothetical protein